MRRAFDIAMRLVSSLIGVAMIAMGTVWMLQGLNLAFRVGFMVGDKHWTVYGAILALVGIAQVYWSITARAQPPIGPPGTARSATSN
jgi:hypothetical protein